MPDTPRTTLTDGTQVYPEHRELKSNGQQQDYVVLADEERAKGFVRPVRHSYKHLKCGVVTTMSRQPTSAAKPLVIGFIVEDHAKADRYVKKLREKFPTIRIIDRFDGPVANTVTVRVGPPLL